MGTRIYVVNISAVDGLTHYSMTSDSRMDLMAFLTQFDHEGAHVSLDTYNDLNKLMEPLYGEDAVRMLSTL